MGQSTDAILCWGVQLELHEEPPWADRAEELGYDDPFDDEAIVCILTGEKLKWPDVDKRLEELGIEVVSHCYHEDPMYIIAACGSVTTANRGYPQVVNPRQMTDPPACWGDKLNVALPKLGIPDHVCRWILCSWWG